MALKRKTTQKTKATEETKDIDKVISKGGTTPKKQETKDKKFVLRIDSNIVDRIDTLTDANPVKMSRNSWIVNAILQQLKREEQQQ